MGIIIKQSIKGSIWSYLGVAVGFVTTAYLFPNYLTTDTIGLFGLLVAWSVIFAQFFSLGINGVTARLFPYFRNKRSGHNGYLFLTFIVMLIGFVLFLVTFFIISPWLIKNNIEESGLFSEYVWLLIPLTFFTLLFNALDSFNKLLYDAVFGTFLIEFLQRLLIISVVILFIFGIINLSQLIISYAGAVSAKGVVIFFYLLLKREINIKPKLNFIDKKLKNEMISVAFFSILTGIGGHVIFNVDKILVNHFLGLSSTGIYTIASFFGMLVLLPSRTLLRISGTLIAEAWKRNDVEYIFDIYKRSCLNQFIIAAFLFGGIWINIDNILVILGENYETGKWVIFFIGLGALIDMTTGANAIIIGYSKYFRMTLWFLLIQIAIFFVAIFLFIPMWGISGAGAAVAVSFSLNNLFRYLFLRIKFKMQPFGFKFWFVFISWAIAYFTVKLIPQLDLVWDILLRSSLFTIIFISIVIGLNTSSDVNDILKKLKNSIKTYLKK
jgi:O-antigen/teichoic acid export membrane protein